MSSDSTANVIFCYTRAQAIADGVLVDVSDTAKEAGIKFPTALTDTVWSQYVQVPEGVHCQDEAGRLWDILWMARFRSNTVYTSSDCSIWHYKLCVRNDNDGAPDEVTLKAHCGPGDNGEPVITIMLPHED